MSKTIAICAFLVAVSLAREAQACTRCADAAADFVFPWNWPVALVLLVWLVACRLGWKTLSHVTAADAAEPGGAKPNAVVMFGAAFGVAFAVGAINFVPSSMLMIPVTLVWLGWLLAGLARSLRRRSWPAATRLFYRLNMCALAAAIVLGSGGWIAARQPAAAVHALHNSLHYQAAVPYVLKAGERVVPALIESLDSRLNRFSEPIPPQVLVTDAWCLSRIGGAPAETALAEVVERRVGGSLNGDGRWQIVLACVYAEGFGAKSLPVLRSLYERESDSDVRRIALTALAHSGGREGVLFAVEHLDELAARPLGEVATVHPTTASIVETTARLLVACRDPRQLESAAVFGPDVQRQSLGIPMTHETRAQTIRLSDAAFEPGLIERIRELDADARKAIVEEWTAVFDAAAK